MPLWAIILVKFHFFSFGGRNTIPEPIKVEFGREEQTYGSLLPAKFHLDRCNMSPLRGEKPKNWLVSKNNTGRAAARGRSCR